MASEGGCAGEAANTGPANTRERNSLDFLSSVEAALTSTYSSDEEPLVIELRHCPPNPGPSVLPKRRPFL